MAERKPLGVLGSPKKAPPPADNSDLDRGTIKSVGVGLPEGERDALQAIADELQVPRNQVLRWAIRKFILEYRSGELELGRYVKEPPPAKKELELPT